jgi:3-methyl-2-oxobutanoate hydroxymethyltransferase
MTVTTLSLKTLKEQGQKFSCLTCYDACFAALSNEAGIDVLLIGDSLGMVLQGKNSTLPVTMDDMVYHTECVMRGNSKALIMADLPFMANNSVQDTLNNAGRLMQAGANIVKVEGEAWLANSITALSQRGIPVCAHLGLTPQSVNKLGGYKVQGKNLDAADRMLAAAQSLEEAGADLLLLECVPRSLAEKITQQVSIPVIGIGAGNVTDGQVLVLHDMLGITPGNKPRFVKNFMTETNNILDALKAYDNAVKSSIFPAEEHSFKN